MVRFMRRAYFWWFVAISAAIVVQFYLAGYAVFGFHTLNDIGPHRLVGDVIGLAILIGIGGAFAARVPWRLTGINTALFVLFIVQSGLAYTGIQSLSALHVVNGVLIFGGTLYLTRELYKLPLPEKKTQVAPSAAAPMTP